MAKQSITAPSYATNNVSSLPIIVKNQAVPYQTTLDKASVDIKAYETNLIAELNGNDGSKKIGHNSPNIASNNVGDAIEEVYQAITSTVLGEIPDNSITNAKLAVDSKVGSLSTLTTTEKGSVIGAINEIDAYVDGVPEQADTIQTDLNILRTAKTTTGSNVALAVDTDGTFDMTRNGNILTIIPNVTNTGAMTVTVDGQATISVKKANDSGTLVDTEAGDSKQNVPMTLVLQTSGTPVFIYAPKGGSNIKSIQRGSKVIIAGASTDTVTISTINTSKSIVKITQTNPGGDRKVCRAELTNSTTITLTMGGTSASNTTISWEVIEFNNVKSLQRGTSSVLTTSVASADITISSVNTSKSIALSSYSSTTGTVDFYELLSSSTTLSVSHSQSSNKVIAYQIVEFN